MFTCYVQAPWLQAPAMYPFGCIEALTQECDARTAVVQTREYNAWQRSQVARAAGRAQQAFARAGCRPGAAEPRCHGLREAWRVASGRAQQTPEFDRLLATPQAQAARQAFARAARLNCLAPAQDGELRENPLCPVYSEGRLG